MVLGVLWPPTERDSERGHHLVHSAVAVRVIAWPGREWGGTCVRRNRGVWRGCGWLDGTEKDILWDFYIEKMWKNHRFCLETSSIHVRFGSLKNLKDIQLHWYKQMSLPIGFIHSRRWIWALKLGDLDPQIITEVWPAIIGVWQPVNCQACTQCKAPQFCLSVYEPISNYYPP